MNALFAFALTLASVLSASCGTETREPGGYIEAFARAVRAFEGGEWSSAREALEDALEASPRSSICAYGLACTASRRGRPVEALDWLERAVDWGYVDAGVAAWDEDLAALRGSRAFERLLLEMRAEAERRRQGAWPEVRIQDPTSWPTLDVNRPKLIRRDISRLTADGRMQLALCGDGTLRIVELSNRREAVLLLDAPLTKYPSQLVVDPHGRFAVAAAEGEVAVVDLERRCWVWRVRFGQRGTRLYLSPTGDRLLVTCQLSGEERFGWGAWLVDVAGRRVVSRLQGKVASWSHYAFSPDGWCLAGGGPQELGVSLWSRNGRKLREFDLDGSLSSLAFHPRRPWLALGMESGRCDLVEVQEGQVVRSMRKECWLQPKFVDSLQFDRSGALLLAGGELDAWLWDAATGETRWCRPGGKGLLCHRVMPAFAPDFERIASGGNHPEQDQILDLDGNVLASLTEIELELPRFSADSRWITGLRGELLEAQTYALCARRYELEGGSTLFVTGAGAVDSARLAAAPAWERMQVRIGAKTYRLGDLAPLLWDPKRVSAALEGVPPGPIDLDGVLRWGRVTPERR